MKDMSTVQLGDLVSVAEAAERLGISTVLVWKYIKQQRLRAAQKGRMWFIDEESLEEFASKPRPVGVRTAAGVGTAAMQQMLLFEGQKNPGRGYPPGRLTCDEVTEALFRGAGQRGLTCDQVSAVTGWHPNQVTWRIKDLVTRGVVEPTERRRETRAGRKAQVYAWRWQ